MRPAGALTAALLAALVVLACIQQGSSVTYGPPSCEQTCADESEFEKPLPPVPDLEVGNRATQWGTVFLLQVKANLGELSPPGVARALGIFSACMHDTIALESPDMKEAYVGTRKARKRRKAAGLAPLENVFVIGEGPSGFDPEAAIDGAAFTAIQRMFEGKESLSIAVDYILTVSSGVPSTAAADSNITDQVLSNYNIGQQQSYQLGHDVCEDVMIEFTEDGFDVLANPKEGTASNYTPKNKPQSRPGITNCSAEIMDRDYWQPLCVPVKYGSEECNVQNFLSPGAGNMTTFGIHSGDSVIPTSGPPAIQNGDKAEWKKQAREVIRYSAALNDVNKLKAEHWADGPDSTFPPGHWYRVAIEAAETQNLDIVETVKVLFLVGMALNDAGVGSWSAKVYYDSIRPLQMIQCGFAGKEVEAWTKPYMGVDTINASSWQPYQATTFVTPPFAGYVSGHSTFSAAASQVLKHYFRTEEYMAPKCRRILEGSSLFEGRIDPGGEFYVEDLTDVPNQGPKTRGYVPAEDVVLCWDTWDDASEDAGISRLHGGIHIIADHTGGVEVGNKVAFGVTQKTLKMWK
eukprot:evm.model.scf_129.9 EVM.evm.TU.scf_129.9   scf_129:95247-100481(+)